MPFPAVDTGSFEFYEPTSVRWGRGAGFDPEALYVSEGGSINVRSSKRRIVKVPVSNPKC